MTDVVTAGTTARWRTIGDGFSGRHNSLNFIRLVLALLVVYDHAYGLGGFGSLWTLNGNSIGTLAVYGFFGISGFLIVGSATRNGAWRYLWQRFLRIFPGFWVCLILTALVFGVLNVLTDPLPHCGLSCYFTASNGPLSYLYRNWLLPNSFLVQYKVSGTPYHVPYSAAWNGSTWTLFFEFLCYLLLVGLAAAGFLRHRLVTLVGVASLVAATFFITLSHPLNRPFNGFHEELILNIVRFTTIFLVGSVLYLYRDKVPDSGWLALATSVLFVAGLFLPNGGPHNARDPMYAFTDSSLLAPLIAYPMLWLGIHLPFQRVGARNDYSYGTYIYGYPVSQLLVLWGAQHFGFPFYLTSVVAVTGLLAAGSWWLVEKRALSLKRLEWAGLPDVVRHPLRRRPLPAMGDPPVEVLPEPVVDLRPTELGEWNGRPVIAPAVEAD